MPYSYSIRRIIEIINNNILLLYEFGIYVLVYE